MRRLQWSLSAVRKASNGGRRVMLPSRTGLVSARADGLGDISISLPHHTPFAPSPSRADLHSLGAAVSSLRYFTALRRFLPPIPVCLGFRTRLGIPDILDCVLTVCQI